MRHVEDPVRVVDHRVETLRVVRIEPRHAGGAGGQRRVIVVVVHRVRVPARIEVRFAELIVLEHAVRVAEAAGPPVRHPLGQLNHAGVVPIDAFGGLQHQHVAELGERPQQLAARDVRLRRQRSGAGDAEERIGNRRIQRRRPQRQVLRIELIDVDRAVHRAAERQVIAARADVAGGQRQIGAELALDVRRVLLYAWRRPDRIDERDARADAAQQAERIADRRDEPVRERIVQRHRRRDRALRDRRVVGVADLSVVAVVRRRAGNRIVVRRPVQPIAPVHDGS